MFFFQNSNFLFFASCFALTNILKSLDTVFVLTFFVLSSFFLFFYSSHNLVVSMNVNTSFQCFPFWGKCLLHFNALCCFFPSQPASQPACQLATCHIWGLDLFGNVIAVCF